MSRSTSNTFKEAVNAAETSEAFLILLTIDHSSLGSPFRFTSDGVDTVSRGDTYIQYPFDIQLPPNDTDVLPSITLTIDNVHRTLVETIRTISSPPSITVEVVLGSDPDTVEMSLPDFILTDVSYDRLTIQGTLNVEFLETTAYPADNYNTVNFRGLF